ncbi:hypothetical protein Tco_1107283 [Tanacetum coccineum]
MAQKIIPAAQLVPKFQGIRRCNNYDVLQSIPCSPECKIVRQILLDHPLSYALTATVDVPAVYFQQFWKTIHKVLDTKDTYTVDMFHGTLKLPVETLDNPFITPVTIRTIESFMQTVGYQDAFLNAKIHATDNYKEYETVFVKVDVPMNQPQPGKRRKPGAGETSSPRKLLKVTIRQKKQSTPSIPPPSDDRERDDIAEATFLSLTLHKIALAAKEQENVAKLNDDVDDSGIRIEPRSYKENPEVVADDDVSKKKDDEKDEDEVNNDNVEKQMMLLRRTTMMIILVIHWLELIQRVELTVPVSLKTATTSKPKIKRGFTSRKIGILPGSITGMCRLLDHCNNVVPEMTFAKTNEMIKEEMPRLVNLAVNKDREVDPINYPTTSSSTAEVSTTDLQQQLYLNMKSKPQDQAADPEL